eukprot:GHRR01015979.1.p2 GENE.GHRR01015979.1~~GHRR01015979.1.p2  ORF type:complete len:104 (-),score=6.28 GHRR01015979.1:709-1020(-)
MQGPRAETHVLMLTKTLYNPNCNCNSHNRPNEGHHFAYTLQGTNIRALAVHIHVLLTVKNLQNYLMTTSKASFRAFAALEGGTDDVNNDSFFIAACVTLPDLC